MGLLELIKGVKEETTKPLCPLSDLSRLELRKIEENVRKRITFPWQDGSFECQIDLKKYDPNGMYKDGHYELFIDLDNKNSLRKKQQLLNEFFKRAKTLKIKNGDFHYEVNWNPEDFQSEKTLPRYLLKDILNEQEVCIDSSAYSRDTNNIRHGSFDRTHSISIKAGHVDLSIRTLGNYANSLEDIIQAIKPQYANLRLSPEDAERIERVVKKTSCDVNLTDRLLLHYLEEALKPKETASITFSAGQMGFERSEIIEIKIPIHSVSNLQAILGKPLLKPLSNQTSKITSLIKYYGITGLVMEKRLPDLKKLSDIIRNTSLGIKYNIPLISEDEGKKLLDREIEIVDKAYQETYNIYWEGYYNIRTESKMLDRLVEEHFGDRELINKSEKMSLEEYLSLLKSEGYKKPLSFGKKFDEEHKEFEERLKKYSIPERCNGDVVVSMLNKKHLFEFFKQSYSKDPKSSVEKLKKWYVNNEPQTNISARVKELPASKIKRLKIPEKSRLSSLSLFDYSTGNALSMTSGQNETKIRLNVNLNNPSFLELQDYLCREMGILFV